MAVKNVVFDIGGVLADFRVMEFLGAKGFGKDMIRRILKASVMTPYWGAFERGELTEDEALAAFASTDPEIEEELRRAYGNVEGLLTGRDFSVPLVKGLKKAGYGVYCLSNYSKKAYDECGESLAFMPYMDGAVLSFRVHMTKPDPAMYVHFLEVCGLEADACVFVDDTPENVEAARALGFHGIVFVSPEDLLEKLSALGVVPCMEDQAVYRRFKREPADSMERTKGDRHDRRRDPGMGRND